MRLVRAISVLAALGGCSGGATKDHSTGATSVSNTSPAAGSATPEQLCAAIMAPPPPDVLAKCTAADRETRAYREMMDGAHGSQHCRDTMKGLATHHLAFDGARAAACIASRTASLHSDPRNLDLAPACVRTVTGLQPVGAECDDTAECTGANRCEQGRCVAAPDTEGAPCTGGILPTIEDDHSGCGNGLVCAADGDHGPVCVKLLETGAACEPSPHDRCGDGLRCVDKRCAVVPPAKAGEMCMRFDNDQLVDANDCAPDAYCPGAGNGNPVLCVAKKSAGAKCSESNECLGRCVRSGDGQDVCGSFCGRG